MAGATGATGESAGSSAASRLLSSSRLEGMSPAQRAALEARLGKKTAAAQPIVAVPRGGDLPVSAAQRRLWFMDQLSPGSAVFNVSTALRFTGTLDLPALTSAVRTLVLRHESLRTVLPTVDGEPVQRILTDLPIDLVPATGNIEAENLHAEDLEAEIAAEAGRPFELSTGPLFRAKLFRSATEAHVLQLTVHHSVCDGWSMGILVDELLALYTATTSGTDAALPEQRLQYADYAAWEALPERAARWEEDLAFWRETLRGAPPVIDLPFDRPRPATQSFRGARHRFELPGALWTKAREIARAERATPLMVLAAGFTALLSRYSGQDEVVMVTPGANRPRVEFESMVGFFANSIALRCDASGAPTFLELVRRVRDTARQAIAHGEVPFDRVVEAADPVRDPSHAPLAQVLFAIVDDPTLDVTIDQDRLHVGAIELDNGTAKYDLSLELWPDASGTLQCVFEYATDLFDTTTVARIAGHLGTLLGDLTAAPENPVTSARLMSEEEAERLLVEFNRTEDPLLGDIRAHELFEQQARRTPDATALVSHDRVLTFAELDARADRLAARLREADVGPESRVALFLDRGVDLVTSVLAVLKAGGAYVPLDVSEPADRVAFMIADAAVQVVVTDTRHLETLGTVSAPVLLLVDVVELDGAGDQAHPPAATAAAAPATAASHNRPAPQSAAYIIYTSGSTGRPKGVVVTQGALANYLAWSVSAYRVAEGGGAPLVSPLRFDLSVTTFFGPLIAGRPVTLIPEGAELATLEATFAADVPFGLVKLTPAHLDALDAAVPKTVVAGSGYLVVGGESLHGGTVAAWRERVPGLRVVNEYGPTEATVGCCVYEVDESTDLSGTVPIGRPIANTRIYVLDECLSPVVRGAVGELYVGGAGLARGYWNRPDLTAERFIPDPFGPPGGRLYRTGDLARIRPDGQLDCLGRADTQVKVRGYRVELEEIEASLTRLPGIREALVLLREDTPGLRRLVAYVSGADADQPVREADLRAALRQDLPDYMIPDAVVVMDALPLASSGKVDRRALPRPTAAEAPAQDAPEQATWLERTIAQVWSEVLRVPSVPFDVPFLELGGHSLLAVQAMARLRKALDIELPLTVFLEAKSVSDLAARIEALGGGGPAARPGLVAVDPTVPVPLSYAQGRLYFLNRLAEDSAFYNVPMALRFDGEFDSSAFGEAVAALWARHGALRTRFPLRDGEPVQELLPVNALTITEVSLATGPGEAAEQSQRLKVLMSEEAARPFDLENGPLLRCTLVELAQNEHVALITLHHVVSDGWSLSLILDDLMAFYRAFAAGRQPDLEPIPFTYLDYTQWQRSWFSGPDLEQQLGYWRDQLSGAPALTLPTDRPRPAVQSFRGARHEVTWSKELSDAVAALAKREGVSLFMALLAGFDVLMARSSGQRDITVGTPIANRTRTELEKIVGFFANTLALRVDLSGDPSFTEVLSRVRSTANAAYAHQDVPFEMVVDAVAPTRSLSYSPLFQVRFALQNANTSLPDPGPGLVLSEIDNDQVTARFDLMVDLWESENGIEGHAEYSTDLFDAETVELLMRRLEALFERLVQDPGQRVFAMDILLPEERERLDALGRGSWPEADGADTHRGFVERLREQAAWNPDEPAITCGAETITYETLFARSTAWAAELAKRGVTANTLVGVYLERSVDFVVAALAILRAGGAYVPLDTAYPEARLAAVVADARPVFVLTTKDLAPTAPGGPESVLALEDVFANAEGSSPALPLPDLDDPAYVVYTSGTHGRPKGVVVSHRSLAAYLDALPAALHLPEAPVFLHTASFAFSSSVRQLAVPLALGGHVVIAAREQLADPQQLVAYAAEHDVDVLDLVPSYLRAAAPALLETAGSRWRPRMILTASEPLLYDLPETIREGLGAGVRLVNMYGQTETTGIVATARIGAGREGRGAVVPLGRPVPGTTVHILDEGLEPVPVGQPGEIVIGGTSLAKGYLHDPELTAQRFIPDPSDPAERRLYRTGDLGRFLPSGKLEFLGRIGDQVKIRGHRVEPAEVASVLSQCEGVGECAVICVDLDADERRLIGYVAGRPGTVPTAAFLRTELKAKLPDYMVPSLVMLDELPHLPNGKVDRAALAALGGPQAGSDASGDGSPVPRTMVEQTLVRIWQEVLRQDRIGLHDDFFTSGGDSLHVIRVVERARKAGIIITPAQFIANPTIAELAEVAQKPAPVARSGADEVEQPVLVPSHRAFMDRDYDGKHLYTHIFSYELKTPLEPTVVRQAVECLLEHHPSLRISFPPDGDSRRVVINEAFERTPFTAVDLSALDPLEQDTAFLRLDRTLHRKIDFDHGPLLHIALVHFGGDRPDQVVAIVHHQLVDNSSWEVISEDLETACAALAEGRAPQLRPTTGTFAQWSRNLDALARSKELEADIPYWTELARRPRPEWPCDYPGGDDLLSLERDVSVRLDADDFALLRRRMPAEYGLTVNQTLLAALLVGYTEWSGQSSVHVDLVGRGRELGGGDLDLTRAIGRFPMTSPRLLERGEATDVPSLLRDVARQLAAVPRAGLGFGLLRYFDVHPEVAAALEKLDRPDIILINWGERQPRESVSALFGDPVEVAWPMPAVQRTHRLKAFARTDEGALVFTLSYSEKLNDRERIEHLAGLVGAALRSFVREDGGRPGSEHGEDARI